MWASLLHNIRLRKLLLAHAHEENPCLAFLEDFADLTTRPVHINGLQIAWVNSEFKFPIRGIKGFARISPLRKHYNMILNLGTGCTVRVHCRTCGYGAYSHLTVWEMYCKKHRRLLLFKCECLSSLIMVMWLWWYNMTLINETRQYNVSFRRVRATVVGVALQYVLHILSEWVSVCVCVCVCVYVCV